MESLIAMMVNTYETTNEHHREWIRQVKTLDRIYFFFIFFNFIQKKVGKNGFEY